MKSRTSFFDKTVLKKDLTRFSPLWALYLIGGLLIMHVLSGFYDNYFNSRAYTIARSLNTMTGPLGILSCGYGFLCAQLLFGDLHNTRLCYGVHAFPLRREGWYLTHMTSGLLMGLVPPLVIVLTLMPMMGKFWFTGLLCFGGLALHYLFFFGLSVFCMMCTGNRFAAATVYGIFNFLSLIVLWFAKTIYIPLLPGVRGNTSIFNRFCPIVELVGRDEFFLVKHLDTCPCYNVSYKAGYVAENWHDGITHDYGFMGLGGDWGYLWVLAAAGIALLVAGLLLYRIRHLERAADFMAFKPMKPIFLTVYTLCVGGVLFYLAEEMADTFAGYVFFVIGIFIGFFTGKMLLERTIRVFKGKSWAGLGILYAAVALSLLLTWVDPIGISRRIPKAEKVEKIFLAEGHISDYQLNNYDKLNIRDNVIVISDPADIAAITEAHSLMLEEHKQLDKPNGRFITLQYQLKNGTRISRTYQINMNGEALQALKPQLTNPVYLFGAQSLEQLEKDMKHIYFSEFGEIPEQLWPSLLHALWEDAKDGHLHTSGSFLSDGKTMYMELRVADQYRALYFTEEATHVQQWFKQYQSSPELLLQHPTLEKLINSTMSIYVPSCDMKLQRTLHKDFLSLLWNDCRNSQVEHYNKWSDGVLVELETEVGWISLVLSPASDSAKWLLVDKSA